MQNYQGFWLVEGMGNAGIVSAKTEGERLWVAPLKMGGLELLEHGENPTFREQIEGKNQLFYGLKYFLLFYKNWIPIYIFDNHNHALYFWYREYFSGNFSKGVKLVHIDQHSDLWTNEFMLDDRDLLSVFDFCNLYCNVGNFILPAQRSGLVGTCEQIRSEYRLLHMQMPEDEYILDIDLDFWSPDMSIENLDETMQSIKSLISRAKCVTIATSPYFLDQDWALELICLLLGEVNVEK